MVATLNDGEARLNIVVVEDHDVLREVTVDYLRGLGHHVTGADSAEALCDDHGGTVIDMLIMDLNLPGEDGVSLTRRFRAAQPNIGIIMLTARTQPAARAEGYSSGADIYLTKPTSSAELGAAVASLARRLVHSTPEGPTLVLDVKAMRLCGERGDVLLPAADVALLTGLARAPGGRAETWRLLEAAGKLDSVGGKAALEVQIARLRAKLVQVGAPTTPIRAVRQFGYQLCVPLTLA